MMKLDLLKYAEGQWDVLHEGRRIGYILGGNRKYVPFVGNHQLHLCASKKKALSSIEIHLQLLADNAKRGAETL